MTPDEYLQRILNREAVDTGPYSGTRAPYGQENHTLKTKSFSNHA
jgi:hypothetical protein